MQLLLTTLPPDPIIYPSFLHSIDHETAHISKIFLGALPLTPLSILPVYIQLIMRLLLTTLPPGPLIYPSFLLSIDCEITTHYSANNKNFPGALPPDLLIYPSCL